MKKLLILIFFAVLFSSCEKTNKQRNTTKNPDTVTIQNDTAIKRSDTSGFDKK